MNEGYAAFLARKAITDPSTGLEHLPFLPEMMFPFQRDITNWALRRGRAALFAGTGLGKSFMELAWADAVHKETGRDILHLAPLAVTAQMVREAEKFGIGTKHVRGQSECAPGINITNYQKLDHFDLSRFGGVILDESSILKSTDGMYRTKLITECARIPFRLAATATPAPNDFMELGNHAEFLGVMSYTDMLATFFTHDGGDTQKWRLKGHAENEFWKWMASWAVMLRKPSDLGYSDAGYDLPPLRLHQHTVHADQQAAFDAGMLFHMPAQTLAERITARRVTVNDRVAKAVSIVISSFWDKLPECHGNLNTKPTDLQKLQMIRNMLTEFRAIKSETQRNSRSISENTIKPTSIDTQSEPLKNKRNTTKDEGKNTPAIQSMPKSAKIKSDLAAEQQNETQDCVANMEYQSPNTTKSFADKAVHALSVGVGMELGDMPSIIAMTPALSEDSCAPIVISPLGCSEIIETCLIGPLNISMNPTLPQWVIWCQLNSEQDALKKALGELAISIHGSHGEDEKELLHQSWIDGDAPVLICKPSMFGHGLNWQHCKNTIFVGLNDSWEQYYQAVRRFWRFGQSSPVDAHLIAAETEGAVVANLQRKERDADRMAAAMVLHMADLSSVAVRGQMRDTPNYHPTLPMETPAWL